MNPLIPLIAAMLSNGLHVKPRDQRQPAKCLLPQCECLTTHNRGYCCAEHCKQHRADLKMQLGSKKPSTRHKAQRYLGQELK